MADQTHDNDPEGRAMGQSRLPKKAGRRRPIDFNALKNHPLATIEAVLKIHDWHPVKGTAQLSGPCPVHKSSNPLDTKFRVNKEKNIWFCHSSKCKKGGNQVDLHMELTGLTLFEAAHDLIERLGIPVEDVAKT